MKERYHSVAGCNREASEGELGDVQHGAGGQKEAKKRGEKIQPGLRDDKRYFLGRQRGSMKFAGTGKFKLAED